jgi:hypothetical protein
MIVTAILTVVVSGFFPGRVGSQDQIRQVETPLSLYPNIETIGVTLKGVSLSKTAELMYRQSGETNWHTGHALVRIPDGRLVSSLFGLSPATSYEVKVLNGSTEVSGSISTRPNELQFTPLTILHVNDDAPTGGDGSVNAPFNTIQEAVNQARILVWQAFSIRMRQRSISVMIRKTGNIKVSFPLIPVLFRIML